MPITVRKYFPLKSISLSVLPHSVDSGSSATSAMPTSLTCSEKYSPRKILGSRLFVVRNVR